MAPVGNGNTKCRRPIQIVSTIETTYAKTDTPAAPLIPKRGIAQKFSPRLTSAATSTIQT